MHQSHRMGALQGGLKEICNWCFQTQMAVGLNVLQAQMETGVGVLSCNHSRTADR